MKKIIVLLALMIAPLYTMAQSIRCAAYECAVGYIDVYGEVQWGGTGKDAVFPYLLT